MSECLAPREGRPRVPERLGVAQLPCAPVLYLDGELPNRVFWELLLFLDADPERPIGVLFCGPVVDTFLGGRELGVRGRAYQLEQKGRGPSSPPTPLGGSPGLTPAAEMLIPAHLLAGEPPWGTLRGSLLRGASWAWL